MCLPSRVQETCSCLPLHVPVLVKLVCIWHYLSVKKIVRAWFNLSSRHLYVYANTCVQETCTYLSHSVFKIHVRVRHYLCLRNSAVLYYIILFLNWHFLNKDIEWNVNLVPLKCFTRPSKHFWFFFLKWFASYINYISVQTSFQGLLLI